MSPLSRISRGASAAPAAVGSEDRHLIDFLEQQHAHSNGRIRALQSTLDLRESQLGETRSALRQAGQLLRTST